MIRDVVGGSPGIKLLVDALCRHASAIFSEPIEATGTPLYTDARLFCERGIPAALRPQSAYAARPAALSAKAVAIAWHGIFSVDPDGSAWADKLALHASIHCGIT